MAKAIYSRELTMLLKDVEIDGASNVAAYWLSIYHFLTFVNGFFFIFGITQIFSTSLAGVFHFHCTTLV